MIRKSRHTTDFKNVLALQFYNQLVRQGNRCPLIHKTYSKAVFPSLPWGIDALSSTKHSKAVFPSSDSLHSCSDEAQLNRIFTVVVRIGRIRRVVVIIARILAEFGNASGQWESPCPPGDRDLVFVAGNVFKG